MKYRFLLGLVAFGVIALASCSDTAAPDGTDSVLETLLTLDVAMVSADALLDDVAELQLGFVGGFGARLGHLPTVFGSSRFSTPTATSRRPTTRSRPPRSTS